MALRHPNSRHKAWPHLWLMTDERQGERLWVALAKLPRGAGVVFRHLATEASVREMLFARIEQIARRRQLVLLRTDKAGQGGVLHPAHSIREACVGRRAGAALILVSPIYPTRTHPGARSLGPLRAAAIARATGVPAIALGGMTHARFKRLKPLGFVGWAAIDGLTPD